MNNVTVEQSLTYVNVVAIVLNVEQTVIQLYTVVM